MTKKTIVSLVALAWLAACVFGGLEYGKTVFYDDVSLGSWAALSGTASNAYYVSGGTYTNATRTNYYRLSYTNLLGRGPGLALTCIFTGNTNADTTAGTNAVKLRWNAKGGAASYIVERSLDAGVTWSNWLVVAASSTNWIDYGTNSWTATIYTNLYTALGTPSVPWGTTSDVTALQARVTSNETTLAVHSTGKVDQAAMDASSNAALHVNGDNQMANTLRLGSNWFGYYGGSTGFCFSTDGTLRNHQGAYTFGAENSPYLHIRVPSSGLRPSLQLSSPYAGDGNGSEIVWIDETDTNAFALNLNCSSWSGYEREFVLARYTGSTALWSPTLAILRTGTFYFFTNTLTGVFLGTNAVSAGDVLRADGSGNHYYDSSLPATVADNTAYLTQQGSSNGAQWTAIGNVSNIARNASYVTNWPGQWTPYLIGFAASQNVSMANGIIQRYWPTNTTTLWLPTRTTNYSEQITLEVYAGVSTFALSNAVLSGTATNNGVNMIYGPQNTNIWKVTSF